MATVDLPSTLGPAFWDKQKAALAKLPKPPPTKLGDELKTLARLHVGVDWNAFGADKLDRAEQARARLAELDAAAGAKVKALADQAQTVEAAATKFETEARKDKQFPKEPLAAAGAVAKAAKAYRSDVDAFVAEARRALAARLAALTAQEKKGAKDEDDKGGADPKAALLVRSRGLDAIRKIKKPAPGAKPIRFLVVQGKSMVATYMGPSVGPEQEKLLKGLIADDAPFKVFKDPQGELVWEKKAVTFVSDVLPGGVAKKMQLWLKQLLKLNLKLRVRRTSGEAEETDGEDIPDDLLVAGEDEVGEVEAEHDGGADTGDAAAKASAEQRAYALRAAELGKRLKQALLDKHPESTKLRALIGFASDKAETNHDYAGAMKALDMVEQLLGAAPAATPTAAPGAPAKVAPSIVYTQTRLVWVATRGGIQAELKKLEQAILDNYRGRAVMPEVTQAVRKLDRVLTMFDESLIDNLDKALNAADAAEKARWHDEARGVIARYQNYLATDPLVKELDSNPFVPIAVQASLSKTLATLASKIV